MAPNEILTLCISGAVMFIGLLGFVLGRKDRNNDEKKENKSEGEHSGQISSDLGYLKKGVEDINTKIEKSNEKHYELVEKVGRLDESVKSAHHRIDTLEENIKGENK